MKAYITIDNTCKLFPENVLYIVSQNDWNNNNPIGVGKETQEICDIINEEYEEYPGEEYIDVYEEGMILPGVYPWYGDSSDFKSLIGELDELGIEATENKELLNTCKDTANKDFKTYYYGTYKDTDYNVYDIQFANKLDVDGCYEEYEESDGYSFAERYTCEFGILLLNNYGIGEVCEMTYEVKDLDFFEKVKEDLLEKHGIILIENEELFKNE